MKTKLRMSGTARYVFRYIALLARYRGAMTLGELVIHEKEIEEETT